MKNCAAQLLPASLKGPYFNSHPVAKAAAFANPELTVLQFPEDKGFKTSKEDVEIGIAVKKGNKELKDAMDAVLEKMTAADFDKMMDEAIQKQPLAK